ncbi:hypothetical protein ASL20_30625 [Cupriavidus necator]|uniref:DUF4123 domain-containing protein n=1 Tax=Cupriavidus necator TaxID=106590 RepID=UPI000735A8B8|nr:DUF4123 domain-containing protein [Cupriavidus necator]KUE85070.1 hypothetical protein ASL20_30625 [Cupriavidus necator]
MAAPIGNPLTQLPWPQAWGDGYLVLDPLNHDPTLADLSALTLHQCLPAGIGDNAHLMPAVVELATVSPADRQMLLNVAQDEAARGDPPLICAWLQSVAPVQEVSSHLASCLTGTDHAGGHALWRFYDPRVFAHMTWLLRPVQLHALLGPSESWGFAWAGDWYQFARPTLAEAPPTLPRPWWPDARQWPTVEQTADIAQVLTRIAGRNKPSLAQARTVDRALRHADEVLHLTLPADRRHYATHVAAFGQPFEDQPKLQAAWPAVAAGEMTLRQALGSLSSDDWELMKIMAQHARQISSERHHGHV